MIPESTSVVLPKSSDFNPRAPLRIPPPCSICGAREKWNPETRRYENIQHDFDAHGLARPKQATEETS